MDQLPRLGKRELICLLSFTCNYVVFVWRGFLFLWVLGMGYVILLWHSLSLPYNYFRYIFLYFEQISYFHISLTNLAINPKKSCFHRIYSINPSASVCVGGGGGVGNSPQTQTQMLSLLYFHTMSSLSPKGLEMFFSLYIKTIKKFNLCLVVIINLFQVK